ncbi:MAG: hypothetical protein KC492_16835 [Myxococcales bacterium]|nr:hypothetical protein [Myxococcales bacterium]
MMKDHDTEELVKARELLARAEAGGDPGIIHIQRLYLRRVGRAAAAENPALGWCSGCNELHPREWFTKDKRRPSGIQAYCSNAVKAARVKKPPREAPPPAPTVPRERATRKCRRTKCSTRWTPAEGDTSRICPGCREPSE